MLCDCRRSEDFRSNNCSKWGLINIITCYKTTARQICGFFSNTISMMLKVQHIFVWQMANPRYSSAMVLPNFIGYSIRQIPHDQEMTYQVQNIKTFPMQQTPYTAVTRLQIVFMYFICIFVQLGYIYSNIWFCPYFKTPIPNTLSIKYMNEEKQNNTIDKKH